MLNLIHVYNVFIPCVAHKKIRSFPFLLVLWMDGVHDCDDHGRVWFSSLSSPEINRKHNHTKLTAVKTFIGGSRGGKEGPEPPEKSQKCRVF